MPQHAYETISFDLLRDLRNLFGTEGRTDVGLAYVYLLTRTQPVRWDLDDPRGDDQAKWTDIDPRMERKLKELLALAATIRQSKARQPSPKPRPRPRPSSWPKTHQ